MESKFTVEFEDDVVLIRHWGAESIVVALDLWPLVKEVCDKHHCFDVLGVAETTEPMTVADSIEHAELFASLGFDDRYRIAWVELNADALAATQFTEKVLKNRYLPAKVFSSVSEAREWIRCARDT
jgi:hypothetical protein